MTRWVPRPLEQLEDRLTPAVVLSNSPTWIDVGPHNISGGQISAIPSSPTNSSVAGAMQAVVADRTDATGNTLYAGGVNGGIWKTTNALAASPTWTPLTDSFPSLSISSIAINPDNNLQILAGIGGSSDGEYTIDPNTGAHTVLDSRGFARGDLIGALYSEDGGANWRVLSNNIAGQNVVGVAVRTTYMLVAGDNGVFRSTDGGRTFALMTAGLPAGGVFDLAADPGAPVVQVASATWNDGIATINTAGPHALTTNQSVVISGLTPNGYNGTFTVSVVDADTFTYSLPTNPGNIVTGGAQDSPANAITTASWAASVPPGSGTATITTATANGLAVGESVTIAGVSRAGYNGTFVVTAVASPTQFSYTLATNPGGTGTGGLEFIASNTITAAAWGDEVATITTSTANTVMVGEQVTIAGVSLPGYNGTFTVTGVNAAARQISYSLAINPGNTTTGGTETNAPDAILSATWFNGLATITTNGTHGIAVGQIVTVNVPSRPGFNGTFVVRATNGTNQFTYALAADPGGTGTNGTATAAANPIRTATFTAGLTPNPGTVTIETTAAHGLSVGESVTIAGIQPAGYNGTFLVTAVLSPTQFTYSLASDPGETTTSGTETANPNADPDARNRFYVALRSSTGPIDPLTSTPGGRGVYITDDGGVTWRDVTFSRAGVPDSEIGANTTNVQIAVFNSGILTNNIVYVAVENNTPTNAGTTLQARTTGFDYAWRNRMSAVSTISWSANQGLDWTRMDAPRAKTDAARIAGIVNDAAGNVTVFTQERHQLRDFDEVLMDGVRSAFVPRNGATPPIYPMLIGGINGARYVIVTGEYSFRLVNRDGTPNGYTGTLDGNGNATWAQILGANAGERPEFFELVADPTRSDTIYLGTDRATPNFYADLNNGALTYTSTLWRGNRLADVTGSGNTAITSNQWTSLTTSRIANGSAPAADVRDLLITSAGRIIAATGGGIYMLPNAAAPAPDISFADWDDVSNTATIFTSGAHGLSVGQSATVFGVASAIPIVGGTANGYNGVFTVTSATATRFSYTLTSDPGEFIVRDSVLGGLATVQFGVPQPFTPGQSVIIHNVLPTGYNGTFVVTSSPASGSPAGVISAADTIATATWSPAVGAAPPFATITTSAPPGVPMPNGIRVGDVVFISGSGVAGYNGQYVVTSVDTPNRRFTYDFPVGTADPGASTGGVATPASANTLIRGSWVADVVTLETAGAHNFVVGEFVTVDSASGGFNGVKQITAIPSATEFSYASVGFNPGTFVSGAGGVVGVTPTPHSVNGATWTAGTARITTNVAHRLREGDTVILSGINPRGYNGTFTVTNVVSPFIFEYDSPLTVTPGTYTGGGTQNTGRTTIVAASGGTLITSGNHYLTVGEAVVITGVPGYNGTFIVTSTTNNTFTTNSGSNGFPDLRPTSLTYTLATNLPDSTPNARAYATDRTWATLNGNLAVADVTSVAFDTRSGIFFAGTIDTQAITQNATGSFDYASFFGATSLQDDFHDQANVFKVLVDNIGLDSNGFATNQTIRYYVGSNFQNIIRQTVNASGTVTSTSRLFFADELSQGVRFSGLNRDDENFQTNESQNVHIAMALGQLDPRRAIFGYNGLYEDSDPSGNDSIGSIVNDVTPAGMTGHVELLLYGGREGGRGLNQIVFMTTHTGQLFVRGEANDAPGVPFGNRTANLVRDFGGPVASIYAVVADPDNYRHFYVAAGDAAGVNKILETTDFGLTFTDISANLIGPATTADGTAGPGKLTTEIRSLILFDTNPGGTQPGELTLIAGGRGGVYRLSSAPDCIDAPWSEYGQALPNTVVNDLQTYTSRGATVNVASATHTAGVGGAPGTATITTTGASGVTVGQSVAIAGVTPNGYNGTFTVTSTPSATTFTYALATDPGAPGTGGSSTPTNQRLVAGTAGRGIWQIVDILGTVAQDPVLTVTGSAGTDVISISLNPNNPNEIQIYDSSAPPASRITNIPRGTFAKLVIDGGTGADKIIVASRVDPVTRMPLAGSNTSFVDFDITVNGGGDSGDQLFINSGGTATAIQTTITATTIGAGVSDTLFVGCGSLTYSGFDTGTVDITTGNGDDLFILTSLKPGQTILRGGDGSENYAITLDPASTSTLTINDVGVTGTDSLTVSGTAAADAFAIGANQISLGTNPVDFAGIENLSVLGLAGNDTFNVTGFGGSASNTYDGGDGSDTYNLTMNSASTATPTVSDTGTGPLDSDTLNINGTAGADAFSLSTTQVTLGTAPTIQTLNYSGLENLKVDGLGAGDTYSVPMDPTGITVLTIADTGAAGTDALNVTGTAAADTFAVSATQIALGTQALNYAGLETTSVSSGAGADVFNITGVGGSQSNSFIGGTQGDTYNVTMNPANAGAIAIVETGATAGDNLNVFGTAGNDAFSVAPTQIVLGAQILTYSAAIESLIVSGLGGNDSVSLFTEGASSNVAFRFDGGAGSDVLRVFGVAGSENVGVDITSATGGGSFSGLRQSAAFGTVETLSFDGGTGTNSFDWRERTGGTYGTANTPEAGVLYTPTGAASGIVRVGSGAAYPTVSFANVNGAFSVSGDANGSNRDTFTLLGVSTAGLESGFGETTSADGSDTITVTDRYITISNAALGTLRQVNFAGYSNGQPSFGVIEVRGGNESVNGDRFSAVPSLLTNILINGMNPTSGAAGDQLTVISSGTTSRYQPTGTALGPPQTRVVQTSDSASLGYFNIEAGNVTIFDTTNPSGVGGGNLTPSAGYYTASTDIGTPAEVLVFNRLTGTVAFTLHPFAGYNGGVHVAIGDVNGDGTPDIVVAAGAGAPPHVKVFDGVSGQEIASFYAYDQGFLGGVELAVGDLDGDGYAEIITGDGPGVGAGPHIKVFDGLSFREKASYYAFDPTYYGGIRVAVGDTNGDGVLDLIVAAQGGANAQPRVSVFDGRDNREIQSFFAYDANFEGGVFLAVGDVNGDGFADIITGAGRGNLADVRAFSGRDVSVLTQFFANDDAIDAISTVPFEGGVRVATVDIDNDGIDDILTAKGPGTFPILRFFRVLGGPALIKRQQVFGAGYAQGVFVGG